MEFIHRHKWQIVGTSFTEPAPFTFQKLQAPTTEVFDMMRRLAEGVTHVYLRCKECGDLKEIDFYGKFTETGNDAELEELRRLVKL